MAHNTKELLVLAANFETLAIKAVKHRFEAPRIVQLYNMLKAEPNEEDRKEIKKWIEEEEAKLKKHRSGK